MPFFASVSTDPNLPAAIDEVCSAVRKTLNGPPHLAVCFISTAYRDLPDPSVAADVASSLCTRLGTTNLIGGSAESIVGNTAELEWQPAVALWTAQFPPSAEITPFALQFESRGGEGVFAGWNESLDGPWPRDASVVNLFDPFSFPADVFLERMNADFPGVPVVGGASSGAAAPGETMLFLGERVVKTGLVGVRLSGCGRTRALVSQGCRPIGEPMVITEAERNEIHRLGGRTAFEALDSVFRELPRRDQALVQKGIFLGRVVSEYRESFGLGDFLIRNVVQADPESGTVVAADFFRAGQTVQFHLRDAETAALDLRHHLRAAAADDFDARGGLLFTCNGRGTRMFDCENHDLTCLREQFPNIQVAGMFAAGEVGPVAGANFLHGHTASALLFAEDPA